MFHCFCDFLISRNCLQVCSTTSPALWTPGKENPAAQSPCTSHPAHLIYPVHLDHFVWVSYFRRDCTKNSWVLLFCVSCLGNLDTSLRKASELMFLHFLQYAAEALPACWSELVGSTLLTKAERDPCRWDGESAFHSSGSGQSHSQVHPTCGQRYIHNSSVEQACEI